MIHAQRQTPAHVLAHASEAACEALRHRLQRRKPRALLADVRADALGAVMIHGAENPTPAVFERKHPCAVRAPHLVWRVGRDASIVFLFGALTNPVRREQPVLAHQPQHSLAADADVGPHPQARPDLAMPLSDKGRGR